ncbi:MAG: tRNA-dihydrouridine synthase family protein [Opitutaceae bacterium]|nr:tRNA-dihydrouridine synthase family protein [Opitutaceae bacterium]
MPSSEVQSPPLRPLPEPIDKSQPLTALAPMQDVTDMPFMTVISEFGSPDYFFTEYFRVHEHSKLEKHILQAITENTTNRPVFAQLIGEKIPEMIRTVKELVKHPIAGIDLNMGCPAPKVYKKNVGGGLLRDVQKIDQLLGALREEIDGLFTVKMRIGFGDTENFEAILALINKHQIDLLSLHGRTVKEMYRSEVHFDAIAFAVKAVNCPVLSNGNVTSARRAKEIIEETGAAGVMIGRSAIRNPWIFQQTREVLQGKKITQISLTEVYHYIERLYHVTKKTDLIERYHVNKMKKYLNFIGQGVDPEGSFLHEIRRVQTEKEFFNVCEKHLLNTDKWFADEPFSGVIARPNCETPLAKNLS